jgi:hypothetical protein
LQRYKDATIRVFPYTAQGQKDAFAFARQLLGGGAALPMPGTPQSPVAAPVYVPASGGGYAPVPGAGTQPPAAPSGSMTDQPWFWPAVGAGAIGLVALVWALTPASGGQKVIIRKATSRFTGF